MSGKGKAGKGKDIKDWHEFLLNEDLSTNDFIYEVVMIVESSRFSCSTVGNIIECSRSSEAVETITKQDLIDFYNSASESKKDSENNSVSLNLLKSATNKIKLDELSSESLAALVKIKILHYKEAFIANRDQVAKLKKQLQDELKKLTNKVDPKGKKGKEKKSTGASKKGKSTTNLEDLYVQLHKGVKPDDIANFIKEPNLYRTSFFETDPNITNYIVLCQIYDPNLIEELIKLGVDVHLFIDIGTELTAVDDLSDTRFIETIEESISSFWEPWILNNYDLSIVLPQSTMFMKYTASYLLTDHENFEDFKRILYNIEDFKRQYKNYYKNVRFINVKEHKPPIHLDCMTTYKALLNQVPNECITIPFLLDSLIEEVCVKIDKNNSAFQQIQNEVSKPKINCNKIHGGPSHQIKYLLNKYDCKLRNIPAIVHIPKTINLRYGNVLEYINGHKKAAKSVIDITLEAFKRFPPVNLFNMLQYKKQSDTLFYNYLFHKWSNEEENMTAKELKYCTYSFLFSRKHFDTLKTSCNQKVQNNNIKSLMFAQGKPYNVATAEREVNISLKPFQSELALHENVNSLTSYCGCKDESVINCSCHNYTEDYCNMVEEFDDITFIQVLKTVFDDYNHFDYKYFAPNDVILLRFYHNTNLNRIRTEKCHNLIRSVLCFRDFCACILSCDTDWFVEQERVYWGEKKEEERKKEEKKHQEMMEQVQCSKNYIIEGSIKDREMKEELGQSKKDKKRDKDKKSKKEDKASKGKKKDDKNKKASLIEKPIRMSNPNIPKTFPLYDPSKTYLFEIYNMGPDCLETFDDTIEFHSVDGLSVSIHKQKWSRKSLTCSFNISSNNNHLILHNILNRVLTCEEPFQFHVNIANGIVMAFSKPLPTEKTNNSKHVITNLAQRKDPIDTIFSKSNELSKPIMDEFSDVKNTTLEYLKTAIKNQIPVFKIISSRLHKYQYVKRIKSQITFPIGKIIKRVLCKPKIFLRFKSTKTVQESKCIPYTDLINGKRCELNMDWKATLPNGLLVQTVPAVNPHLYYIKQKYMFHRSDLKGIKDESYRCFLRNGTIMKFLKDGSIKTYSPDKNISHYKYGCFSSNTRKKPSVQDLINNLPKKKEKNIIPVHFYINNLTRLQKRIRKMCNRYKTHLIDIADNYHFESSRLECRKLHKVYKLTKKLYTDNTYVIPLLNYTVITDQGRIIDIKNNIVYDHEKRYRQMEYTDYLLSETIIHREDGTSWLMNTNGNAVTQFPDGTRITTWLTELNDNLMMDDLSFNSRSKKSSTPSMDKYCQVGSDSCSAEIESDPDLHIEDDFDVIYTTTGAADEGFFVIGLNYMFEHPNYATVTYYCTDEVTNIKMPDNVQITASKTGVYTVNLLNNDAIDVNVDTLEFKTNKTTCKLNILPLITDDINEKSNFLFLKDSTSRVFQVSYKGDITNYEDFNERIEEDTNHSLCSYHNNDSNERYFILRRDYTGEELYHEPIPNKFIHTLSDNEFNSNSEQPIILEESLCTTIIRPLRKTYSEHLMMLYDLPILATTNEKRCIEKLWKLHNFDMNTVINKRNPLFTFKRLISRLRVNIINTLSDALSRCLSDGDFNEPNLTVVDNISESVKDSLPPVITIPQKLISLKSKTVKQDCEKYRELIKQGEIPKYFDTLFGVMFSTAEECSEDAMQMSSGFIPPIVSIASTEDETEDQRDKSLKSNITEYPGTINVPQDLTIHIKPDSYVHDIEFTSTGLRIITDNYTKNYPFPKSRESSPLFEKHNSVPADNPQELTNNMKLHLEPVKSNSMTEESKMSGNSRNEEQIKLNSKRNSKKDSDKKTSRKQSATKIFENIDGVFDKSKNAIKTQCEVHEYPTCTYDDCMCYRPTEKTEEKNKCHCSTALCYCSKSRRSESSVTSVCSLLNFNNINFVHLAGSIVQFFETSPSKINTLEDKLDVIIQTISKTLDISKIDAQNLHESLKYYFSYIPEKTDKKKLTKHEMLSILDEVKNSLTDTSVHDNQLNAIELDVIASSINMGFAESRTQSNKTEIILEIKNKFQEINISQNEMNEVLNIVEHKIKESESVSKLNDPMKAIPKQFRKIINEINKTIELFDDFKSCCKKCGARKDHSGIISSELKSSLTSFASYFCTNPECIARKNRHSIIQEPKTSDVRISISNTPEKNYKNNKNRTSDPEMKYKRKSFDTNKARKFKVPPGLYKEDVVNNTNNDSETSSRPKQPTPQEIVETQMIKCVAEKNRNNVYDVNYNRST